MTTISADAIRQYRDTNGLSQKMLAARLGCDQATVSRLENGLEPQGPLRRLLEILLDVPGSALDAPLSVGCADTSPQRGEETPAIEAAR